MGFFVESVARDHALRTRRHGPEMIAVVYQINRVGIYLPLPVRFVSCLPPSSRLAILPSKASHGCIPGKARRSCDGLYPSLPSPVRLPLFRLRSGQTNGLQ